MIAQHILNKRIPRHKVKPGFYYIRDGGTDGYTIGYVAYLKYGPERKLVVYIGGRNVMALSGPIGDQIITKVEDPVASYILDRGYIIVGAFTTIVMWYLS